MNKRVETNKKPNHAAKYETTTGDLNFIKILKVIVILMMVALAWFGRRALRIYEQLRNPDEVHHNITKMNDKITHLDEVLTMSAKMATAIGVMALFAAHKIDPMMEIMR